MGGLAAGSVSSAVLPAVQGGQEEERGMGGRRAGDIELTCSQLNLEGSILEIVIAGSKNNMQ